MGRSLVRAVAATAVAAFLVACSSSGSSTRGTATVPTAPPTTGDPWAVPSTITPDYLNKVLAKLNQIDGDAVRDARRTNSISPLFTLDETAIRADKHEVDLVTKDWQSSLSQHFNGIKVTPGNRVMKVMNILAGIEQCVLASVSIDFSAITDGTSRSYPTWFIGLLPVEKDPLNPTGWQFIYDGFEPTGLPPNATVACAKS